MTAVPSAYLVLRRDDGFGDVFPLAEGSRYTLGRAPTNRIVLKDDLCSREHAEVFHTDRLWYIRDLGSLNGTRVNGKTLADDRVLAARDEVHLGRTVLLFVDDLDQLPDLPPSRPGSADEPLEIKKRLAQTRYVTGPAGSSTQAQPDTARMTAVSPATLAHDLGLLYKLALDMGTATDQNELVQLVLDALLAGVPAEVGAVLTAKDNREFELLAYRNRSVNGVTYHKVSQFVSAEVVSTREAVLAENVARDRHLKNRDSLAELQVASLICAPVLFEGSLLGLIHLYSTDPKKPLDSDHLEFALAVARQLGQALHQLGRQNSLTAENRALKDSLRLESELVGSSPPLKTVESQIARVAATNATILVRGESGVGKELVARAIHLNSNRRDGPFICLNCAALTETLLESELFGHEKGAFTGATEKLIGKFESAHQGTIFLDEIGEMALGTQAKFLRVLEGHPVERVGGNTPIRVDVRVVAATNRPLEDDVRAGTFRRDLYYRLQVVEIQVPPLRDRVSDIRPLAEHFLKRFVREMGRKVRGFTPEAMKKLETHPWPGNVRELRNVVERAVALATTPLLDVADIWLSATDLGERTDSREDRPAYAPISLAELEKEHVRQTLEFTHWNKSQAATILGIERSTLDRKIKAYDIHR